MKTNYTYILFIAIVAVILTLFICHTSEAQIELLGSMTMDTVKYNYWEELQPLLDSKTFDKKSDNTTILYIPIYKSYGKTKAKSIIINFELYLYNYDSETFSVSIIPPKEVAIVEYNLKNHKWKKFKYNHDNYNDFKEKDVEKLKGIIKEKEKKEKP